jgi:hypothetical protein
VLILGEQLQNPDSCRVPEGLEELGLLFVDRFWHRFLPFSVGGPQPRGTLE